VSTLAGWYPDPSGIPGQRYFDGVNWTEHAVAAERMPDERRTELLEQHVMAEVSGGARVELQSAFRAVVVYPPNVNHVMHFVLCLLTCWLWALVWLTQVGKRERRYLIQIDPYGVLTRTQVFS
jgi:hypothetical protein